MRRLFLVTDERVGLPLGARGAEHLKHLQDKPDLLREVAAANVAAGGKSLVFVQSRRRAEDTTSWSTSESPTTHGSADKLSRRRV